MTDHEYDDVTKLRLKTEEHFHDNKYSGMHSEPAHYHSNPAINIFHKMMANLSDIQGKKVLEFGCGDGWLTAELASRGAEVYAFDISEESVKATKDFLQKNNLLHNCTIVKMAAEEIDFPDQSFDFVIGYAILHHVDLNKVIPSVIRIMKSSGRAIFAEPMAGNPFLQLYRRLTPQYRTPDEKPLDFAQIVSYENNNLSYKFSHEEFYLISLIPLFLTNLIFFRLPHKLLDFFFELDRQLFKHIPFTKKWAWYSLLMFKK